MRKLLEVAAVSAAILLAACNTVEGAGEDVQSVANATENAIDE